MTASFANLQTLACGISLTMLLVSVLLVLIRLWRGPSTADRVVALDLFSVLVVAILVVVAILREESADLDVAIAYSLVAYLGTVALARYIHWRAGVPHHSAGRRAPQPHSDEETAHD
ncbi:MAG: monovalent cation/H+ antiporter complex subunit F [Desulfosarcinaceae bacterium]|nr:monovalent cation/H+ antiporter complex subunit F [Desulfosarcinaceae bacterium]